VLVVDLHGVTFLGVVGVLVLARVMDLARHNGTRRHVVSSTVAVGRALSLLDSLPEVRSGHGCQRRSSKI
jgi:anti-anti-sigma regulatory factor